MVSDYRTKQKDGHYVRYTPLIQMLHDQAIAFRPMVHINSVKTLQPERVTQADGQAF